MIALGLRSRERRDWHDISGCRRRHGSKQLRKAAIFTKRLQPLMAIDYSPF
jgi:hypothetical protein